MKIITIVGRPVRLVTLAVAAVAAVTGLAVILAVALGGHHGSSSSAGVTSPTPPSAIAACVASRLANGDQQAQQSVNPALTQGEARQYCSMGAAFDGTSDPSTGMGPNTAPWPLGTT
jgi:hypothetical protein